MKNYFLLVLLFLSLMGCDNSTLEIKKSGSQKTLKKQSKDVVKIKMLEPSDWLQYKAGEKVTLKTTLEYSLISSEFATMSLIIQGPNFKSIAQKDMEVSNQESSMTIEVDITVPKDKTMSVFGALTLRGQDNSISADSRNIELYN